jgi:hypothetical protein
MKVRLGLSVIALGALVALATTSCSTSTEVTVPNPPQPDTTVTSEEELRDGMRALWTQHVVWTRVFLIDTIAGLPDAPQATDRLLQNQADIGDAVRPFYGDAAADQLTDLLTEHILGAADVLTAAMAGDDVTFELANAAWYDNGYDIAVFLASANPNWSADMLADMMTEHLDLTLDEATARLNADWDADVAIYDQVQLQILDMADMLTDGLAAQFPDRVLPATVAPDDEELHLGMRELWEDHVLWTRVFLIDSIAGLPDTPAATDRLLQNQVDIGDAVRPIYGDAAADQLTALLTEHILGAAEVLEAAMVGDDAGFEAANAAWYQNGYEIAAFLASANPHWSVEDLAAMMNEHLDLTLDEATARLTGDWDADVAAYDAIEVEILDMSDVLSAGISAQMGHDLPVN